MSGQQYSRKAWDKAMATPPTGWKKSGQSFSLDRFVALCEARGLDPAEKVMDILEDAGAVADLKPKERLDAYLRLMEYAYPKLRATENTHNVNVTLSDLLVDVEHEWHATPGSDPGVAS